jgi:hypothetical protein
LINISAFYGSILVFAIPTYSTGHFRYYLKGYHKSDSIQEAVSELIDQLNNLQ